MITQRLIDGIESVFRAQDGDMTSLHQQLAEYQQKLNDARAEIFRLEERVRQQTAERFVRSSERWGLEARLQARLFNETEMYARPRMWISRYVSECVAAIQLRSARFAGETPMPRIERCI